MTKITLKGISASPSWPGQVKLVVAVDGKAKGVGEILVSPRRMSVLLHPLMCTIVEAQAFVDSLSDEDRARVVACAMERP